jgi:uncharacterized membrane protein YkoI
MTRKLLPIGALLVVAGGLSAGVAIAAGAGDGDRPLAGTSLERATAAALAHAGGGTVVETEARDDGAAYVVDIRLGDGRYVEVDLDAAFRVIGEEVDDGDPTPPAAGAGDGDQPLAGTSLERATAAALAHTGGGIVVETEVGDDGAAYGVEIRLDDGRMVEVSLDADYNVIGEEVDDDSPYDED